MQRCLLLAEKGRCFVQSNPMVGAVLVSQDENIICEGYHEAFGSKHAEANVLMKTKTPPQSILFINLEPCCHQGKTPPCTDLIIKKKISKVIIGCLDPNLKVKGKGIKHLLEAGIKVEVGICKKECEILNQKYFIYHLQKRVFVALKIAASLDGKIALESKKSHWITGKDSRQKVHLLRSEFTSVAIGKNTLLEDNPQLTNRLKGDFLQPIPIIFWGKGEFPQNYFLAKTKRKRILILNNKAHIREITDIQKENLVIYNSKNSRPKIKEVLEFLYKQKIYSLLVEGGAEIFSLFLQDKLVDKIYLFQSAKIIGGKGKNWTSHLKEIATLKKNNWRIDKTTLLGEDILLEITSNYSLIK